MANEPIRYMSFNIGPNVGKMRLRDNKTGVKEGLCTRVLL